MLALSKLCRQWNIYGFIFIHSHSNTKMSLALKLRATQLVFSWHDSQTTNKKCLWWVRGGFIETLWINHKTSEWMNTSKLLMKNIATFTTFYNLALLRHSLARRSQMSSYIIQINWVREPVPLNKAVKIEKVKKNICKLICILERMSIPSELQLDLRCLRKTGHLCVNFNCKTWN